MSTLYERISALCSERGITGYRLCKDIGISPSTLSDLKFGRKSTLSSSTATRIAKYLGVSVSYLINGEEEKSEVNQNYIIVKGNDLVECLEDLRTRPETRTLLAATRGMTKEQVELMANFAKTIRGENH